MTMTDLLPIFTQIPLVGAFIWFTLEMARRQQEAQDNRDKLWREFLETERKASNEVLIKLTGEISLLNKSQTETHQLLIRHDALVGEAVDNLRLTKSPTHRRGAAPSGGS